MQRFELLGRSGAGANSTVYRCRDTSSGNIVAVKKLEGATLAQILQEAAIMRICAHRHCAELVEAHQGSVSGVVYLVMENVEHSLSRELLLNPRGLPLGRAKLIVFQLAQALELIHSKQISHGDIKPANILLTSQCSVKLCDFGSATSPVLSGLGPGADGSMSGLPSPSRVPGTAPMPASFPPTTTTTAAASRWYCAPESLLGLGGSSPAADIWALGCILAELITGKPLMPGSEEELNQLCWVVSMLGHLSSGQERMLELLPWEQRAKLQQARARGPLLDRIPKIAACPELLQALRACLHPDPVQRPTAAQLRDLPLFADLREALQADEAAAAATEVEAATTAATVTTTAAEAAVEDLPCAVALQLKRRTSSGDMDIDGPAANTAVAASPEPAVPCPPVVPSPFASQGLAGAGTGGCGDAEPAARPVRRVGGVQAAVPVRPTPRNRVSALTATIRGKPFEGDGEYVDLMPQVARLVALWQEQAVREEDKTLGPIALAARRSSSIMFPAASLASALSGELATAAVTAMACNPASAAPGGCATPIAAAAGGCGSARHVSSSPSPSMALGSGGAAVSGGLSPKDCTPAAPVTVAAAAAVASANLAGACAKHDAHMSSSVGATPLIAKAAASLRAAHPAGATPPCGAVAAALVPASVKPSTAHLRSRAIINRARRHHPGHSREPRGGSVPLSFLAESPSRSNSSCYPGVSGLGTSATLLQRERAYAAAAAIPATPVGATPARPLSGAALAARAGGHATRRSFADLSDLASVAEYAPLACGTPPDGKRRRGSTYGLQHPHLHSQLQPGSASGTASPGSLQTELSLGSLLEHEAPSLLFLPGRAMPFGAPSGGCGRRMRRNSSGGSGLFATGSPARYQQQHQQHQWMPPPGVAACAAARAVDIPQPVAGRGRGRFGTVGRVDGAVGVTASVGSEALNSGGSDVFLREEEVA